MIGKLEAREEFDEDFGAVPPAPVFAQVRDLFRGRADPRGEIRFPEHPEHGRRILSGIAFGDFEATDVVDVSQGGQVVQDDGKPGAERLGGDHAVVVVDGRVQQHLRASVDGELGLVVDIAEPGEVGFDPEAARLLVEFALVRGLAVADDGQFR